MPPGTPRQPRLAESPRRDRERMRARGGSWAGPPCPRTEQPLPDAAAAAPFVDKERRVAVYVELKPVLRQVVRDRFPDATLLMPRAPAASRRRARRRTRPAARCGG